MNMMQNRYKLGTYKITRFFALVDNKMYILRDGIKIFLYDHKKIVRLVFVE